MQKKTTSKRAIQKTAEATVDLIGNKAADKITSAFRKRRTWLWNTKRKNYISRKRQQIIDELRLV